MNVLLWSPSQRLMTPGWETRQAADGHGGMREVRVYVGPYSTSSRPPVVRFLPAVDGGAA